jgi:hypothetical protein
MLTQNRNEAFNTTIWRCCPKTEPTSKKTIEIALAMASTEYNMRAVGYEKLLLHLKVPSGSVVKQRTKTITHKRLRKARRACVPSIQVARKKRKYDKALSRDKQIQKEGPLYEAGAFNM